MKADLHASAVVIGDRGVLITGPSGAGKSTLARRLIDLAATNFIPQAVMDLLVSCETVIKTRLPDVGSGTDTVLGIPLPRIEVRPDDPEPVWIALGFGHLTVRS